MTGAGEGDGRLLVATRNVGNLADRWDEHLPPRLTDMAALRPDPFGQSAVGDPPLCPSDHIGIAAHVRIGRATQ